MVYALSWLSLHHSVLDILCLHLSLYYWHLWKSRILGSCGSWTLFIYCVRVTGHKFELLHDLLTFCCNLLNLWFVLDRLMLVYQCIYSLWFVLNSASIHGDMQMLLLVLGLTSPSRITKWFLRDISTSLTWLVYDSNNHGSSIQNSNETKLLYLYVYYLIPIG